MVFFKIGNMVRFDLELSLDQNMFSKGWFDNKDIRYIADQRDKLKGRLTEKYPLLEPYGFNLKKNAGYLKVKSDLLEFTKVFGGEIAQGIYWRTPSIPKNLFGFYTQWYQTSPIKVPESLCDLVKSVNLSEPDKSRINLYVPKAAKEYEKMHPHRSPKLRETLR